MISKRIAGRKDGKTSAAAALSYGHGLTPDRETGELLDKSHRTRLGNFGLVDDGVYSGHDAAKMTELIKLAGIEMQSNCDLNTRVGADKRLAHFVVSYNQDKPSESVLRDTEDSMLSAMKLDKNHFATFLHDDNNYYHLHIFASRIEKEKPHRGNPLWRDKTLRDKVCREVEIRHGLLRDNGLHEIDSAGKIIEIPLAERIAKRDAKPVGISDRARTTEIYSGEKTFQTWCNEIRIGDRLKHAKSWQDLHVAAAAYRCDIRAKGAGFTICPAGEKGGIQLSKVGLKNLPAKFGAFQVAKSGHKSQPEAAYKPAPTNEKGVKHYNAWRKARDVFKPVKIDRINELREAHKQIRADLRVQHKSELEKIRGGTQCKGRAVAISVAKMEQSIALATLADRFSQDRQSLYKQLAVQGPGNTFRDYLVKEAVNGDNIALGLARKYGVDESTDVSRKREAVHFKIVAVVTGQEYRPASRINFTHRVERNGTIIFDLGHGRLITDSAISKQVQLNDVAANDPEAIATALRFATTKFGNTLTLTGSQEFQRLAVETAVLNGLGIKFADPALEAYREKFTAEQQRKSPITKEQQNAPNHRSKQTERIPPAHLRDRMHYLSEGDMVLDTERHVGALQQNVPDRVGQSQERGDHRMQRTTGGSTGAGGRSQAIYVIPDPRTFHDHQATVVNSGNSLNANIRIVRPAGAAEHAPEDSGRGGLSVTSSYKQKQLSLRAAAEAAEKTVSPITPVEEPIIQTPQECLRALVLATNPDAQFVVPDPSDIHRLYTGPVVASLDPSEGIGFAQSIGRGVYVLHSIDAPALHKNNSIDVKYSDGLLVATVPDHQKGKGGQGE